MKSEHGMYLAGASGGVGSVHFSSSSKPSFYVSRLDQYEFVYDNNGEAVIRIVQQDEEGAAASNVSTDAASSFSV